MDSKTVKLNCLTLGELENVFLNIFKKKWSVPLREGVSLSQTGDRITVLMPRARIEGGSGGMASPWSKKMTKSIPSVKPPSPLPPPLDY